jgi:hypothetical protein
MITKLSKEEKDDIIKKAEETDIELLQKDKNSRIIVEDPEFLRAIIRSLELNKISKKEIS